MAQIDVYDRADEFRIVIMGQFSDECVDQVARACKATLLEANRRRLAIDISHLSGYDAAGRKLLQELYHYGTTIAAGTPQSLDFLSEISTGLVVRPDMLRKANTTDPDTERRELKRACATTH